MPKYIRLPSGYYARRRTVLQNAGFEDFEIQEITQHYTTFRRKIALGSSDPAIYLARMIRWRRLYMGNLKRAGYTPEEIHQSILKLYQRKGWTSAPEGFVDVGQRRDPLKMLRSFRKKSIDEGEYKRPPRRSVKGSHHPLKRKDVTEQGNRRATKKSTRRQDRGIGGIGYL